MIHRFCLAWGRARMGGELKAGRRPWSPAIIGFAAALIVSVTTSVSAEDWNPAASLPGLGRHHPVTFFLNGYGYAATGTTTQSGVSDDFYRYDPVQDAWVVLPDFPGADRSYAYGGAFNGKGYLGFGLGGGYLADLWEYDPVSELWTQLPSLPGGGRMHPAFVITDEGKLFVGAGNNAGNFRDWWEYNIASHVWTRRADFPGAARHHPFYFNIGKYPYVGFGHGASAYRDLYRFDPDNGTWSRMQDFPGEARLAGTQFTYGNKGYILSGLGEHEDQLATGEFWEYDPTTDGWYALPPHPGSGRWAPGNFLDGSTLYMMAGESVTRMERDMWRFDLTQTAGANGAPAGWTSSLTLSPNPVTAGVLHLRNSAPLADAIPLRLLDVNGRQISELPISAGVVRLPEFLRAGQYFLVLRTQDGREEARKFTVF